MLQFTGTESIILPSITEQKFGFIVQSGAPLKVSVLCYYVLLCLRKKGVKLNRN